MRHLKSLFERLGGGPIIRLEDLDFPAGAVLNPGAVGVDGEILLLLRVEDRRGISHIRVARSANGVDRWRIDDTALLEPDLAEFPFEEWGCEDARVTLTEDGEYVIAYTSYSRYGPSVSLATTRDFVKARRLGIVLAPENKDAAVFPRRFDGSWVLLHRPVTGAQEHIWYSESDSGLDHWSRPGVLLPERGGPWWDGFKVGVGAPPIETRDGWLLIYHGVKQMALGLVYRLGLALLDLENPRKVLARSSEWVFSAEEHHEVTGLVPNTVYTCGAVLRGEEIWMYYGAADTAIGLAVASIPDALEFVRRHDYLRTVGRDKGMLS